MRFERCFETGEGVVLAYAADLVEVETAGLARCDCDGPGERVLAIYNRVVAEFTSQAISGASEV